MTIEVGVGTPEIIAMKFEVVDKWGFEDGFLTLKLKLRNMKSKVKSTVQSGTKSDASEFAEGLKQLSETFKADATAKTEEYETYIKETGTEFQEESHTYAKDMTTLANQYTLDIQALYQSIYGTGEEVPPTTGEGGEGEGGEGEELPPPTEGEGAPDQTLPPASY